jgi:hypothetical protein
MCPSFAPLLRFSLHYALIKYYNCVGDAMFVMEMKDGHFCVSNAVAYSKVAIGLQLVMKERSERQELLKGGIHALGTGKALLICPQILSLFHAKHRLHGR